VTFNMYRNFVKFGHAVSETREQYPSPIGTGGEKKQLAVRELEQHANVEH